MGPLEGIRIVEFAGLGPAPFGAMMLADLGADIPCRPAGRLSGAGSEPRLRDLRQVRLLQSARRTGKGQVMDAAIVDGSALLYATIKSLHKAGSWPHPAGGNTIDGGRYFYRVYACADGGLVTVAAIEPAFRAVLLNTLGFAGDLAFANDDPLHESERREKVARVLVTRRRDEWAETFSSTDGCVAPVLTMDEAEAHPQTRTTFVAVDGVNQPAPGPRFSATPGTVAITPEEASRSDPQALAAWGFQPEEIARLTRDGIAS